MLSYVPFTVKDEDAAAHVLAFCDHLTMYSENAGGEHPARFRWGLGDRCLSVSFPGRVNCLGVIMTRISASMACHRARA